MRPMPATRTAPFSLMLLCCPAALVGEEAPDTTWLSPLFELESIDKIDERMNREFFPGGEGIPLVKGGWPGDDETFTNNCISYEKLYSEGYYARTNHTSKVLHYDSFRFGIPIPEGAPTSTQERAYTSPIWYTP